MSLKNSSTFTGSADSENTGDVTVTLDSSSKWNVTADSYVTAIVDEDGTFSNIVSNGHTIYYSASDGGKLVAVK